MRFYSISHNFISFWGSQFFASASQNDVLFVVYVNQGLLPSLNTTFISGIFWQIIRAVYFFHRIYDYTVSYNLAKNYFDKLKAPIKGFYTFEKSAHSLIFEEPERMKEILQSDILKGIIKLSDPEADI